MTISSAPTSLHWNYFLALERDLETLSRYVEFREPNFQVFSIELAHLLFASASEVDVLAKLLCERLEPAAPRQNISHYKQVLVRALPSLPNETVFVPRYGLHFKPWANWGANDQPDWWRSYNRVKHERDSHFDEATLKNALNALGALLIFTFHYYSYALAVPPIDCLTPKKTTSQLQPESVLLQLDDSYYRSHLVF